MRAYSVIAAALAAFAIGTLHSMAAPSNNAAEKPLQLTEQEPSARPSVKKERRKHARATRRAPADKAAPATSEENPFVPAPETAVASAAPLAVVVVRTTRESGSDSAAPVVQPDELSDIDRAASEPSLVASTILSYLGGPANIEESQAEPLVNTEDFPAEAKQAYAAEPAGQKPAEVALEYILMTFGGALAAASAIRLFVV